jgi:hypothetical protein
MKKASEYRQHAEECRVLARNVKEGVQREQLLEMARNWEQMAEDRDRGGGVDMEVGLEIKPKDT